VSGLRKLRIGTAVSAALATMLVGPTVASAGPVEDLVNQVSNGVNQTLDGLVGGGGKKPNGDPDTQGGGGGESEYVPPAHGTNPHGQGTVGVLDESLFTPDPETLPYPHEEGGASEAIVIGRSRGEQNPDGTYHGHVSILTLFGTEVLEGADTNEGETEGGPVTDLNDALDEICADAPILLCLQILDVDSETDENGSENSFELVGAEVGLNEDFFLFVDGGSSRGEIREEGGCQTATGESTVGSVGIPFFELAAGSSESRSQACNNGTTGQQNESNALLFDLRLVEALDLNADCENGVPDTPFLEVLFVAAICNADDSSNTGGTQLDHPYGVREAFTLFVVDFLDLVGEDGGAETLGLPVLIPILFKTTLAASESFAVAPPEEPPVCPDPANPDCPEPPVPPPLDGDEPEVEEELTSDTGQGPGEPGEPTGRADDDVLPFTGADVGLLALIGAAVMATGLAVMAFSDRRRRVRERG
jgi:hypothetical protein